MWGEHLGSTLLADFNGILFSRRKEGNPSICYNMDEPGGHYVKQSKPDAEGQILHDRTYMWNLQKSNSKAESRMVFGSDWEAGKQGNVG